MSDPQVDRLSLIARDRDRLIAIHALLDPSGTSLKSIEELIAALVKERDAAQQQLRGAVDDAERLREVLRAVLIEPDPIKRNQLAAPVLTTNGGQ